MEGERVADLIWVEPQCSPVWGSGYYIGLSVSRFCQPAQRRPPSRSIPARSPALLFIATELRCFLQAGSAAKPRHLWVLVANEFLFTAGFEFRVASWPASSSQPASSALTNGHLPHMILPNVLHTTQYPALLSCCTASPSLQSHHLPSIQASQWSILQLSVSASLQRRARLPTTIHYLQ